MYVSIAQLNFEYCKELAISMAAVVLVTGHGSTTEQRPSASQRQRQILLSLHLLNKIQKRTVSYQKSSDNKNILNSPLTNQALNSHSKLQSF